MLLRKWIYILIASCALIYIFLAMYLFAPSSDPSMPDIIAKAHPVRVEFRDAVAAYIDMHKQAMDVKNTNARKDAKLLIFSPTGQLCNRMRGTVAAFTFAFLTNRVFVLRDFGYRETSSFFDLFESPGFDIEGPKRETEPGKPAEPGMPEFAKLPTDFINMNVDGREKSQQVEKFLCTDWGAHPNHIKMTGTDYLSSYLYRNPYLQAKIKSLFLDEDMFRPFLFWLFRPILEIVRRKDEFLASNRMTDGNCVAFHIRNEFPVSPEEWTAFRQCANATSSVPLNRGPDPGPGPPWFIATDSEEAIQIAKYNLNNNSVAYLPKTGFLKGAKLEGLRQALTDILIASSCDKIFLSPFSSFSRMIGLYARSPYTHVVTDFVMPEEDTHRTMTQIQPFCYRYLRKDECSWPGYNTSVNKLMQSATCYSPYMISDIC